MAPENGWLEDEFPFGARPIFRAYVSFREGIVSICLVVLVGNLNHAKLGFQVIQAVTFCSPIVRGHLTYKRVT